MGGDAFEPVRELISVGPPCRSCGERIRTTKWEHDKNCPVRIRMRAYREKYLGIWDPEEGSEMSLPRTAISLIEKISNVVAMAGLRLNLIEPIGDYVFIEDHEMVWWIKPDNDIIALTRGWLELVDQFINPTHPWQIARCYGDWRDCVRVLDYNAIPDSCLEEARVRVQASRGST